MKIYAITILGSETTFVFITVLYCISTGQLFTHNFVLFIFQSFGYKTDVPLGRQESLLCHSNEIKKSLFVFFSRSNTVQKTFPIYDLILK